MSDRFKFRVWDIAIKQYIDYGQWLSCAVEFNFNPFTKEVWCEFDNSQYIVEQCTGLKDKNGNLIYEGDIVKDVFDGRPVIWCRECCGFQFAYSKDYLECMACGGDDFFVDLNKRDVEIVGNIHA